MTLRWLCVRVNDGAGLDHRSLRAVSIWWLALAAAEETLQGGILTRPWLRLFRAQLSSAYPQWLQWRGDLGESAEIRRAYSALYGRYATRGLLQALFGFRNFVPLHRNVTTIPGGVRVRRNSKGDIPDWIAWDSAALRYVLAEAKGNLTGTVSEFVWHEPTSVHAGKAQFGRVDVEDNAGSPISASEWVGASLWATDVRNRLPVFVAWDPDRPGRTLRQEEWEHHSAGITRRWIGSLAGGLGYPELRRSRSEAASPAESITVIADATPGSFAVEPVEDWSEIDIERDEGGLSTRAHKGRYLPVLITANGIVGLRGPNMFSRLVELQNESKAAAYPVLLAGLNVESMRQSAGSKSEVWVSDNGIAGPSGLALFDLRRVSLEP